MNPDVSVIIPVYEADPAWLRAAVKSALFQEDVVSEVIVCDDGSAALVDLLLADLPVSVIRQCRQGPASARNCAAREARAPWLAFLDADDLWDPGKLTIELAAADSAQVDVVYSNGRVIDGAGQVILERQDWVGPVDSLLDLVPGNRVPLSSAIVRRQVFEAVGGFDAENRFGAEDYGFWLAVAAAGWGFKCLPEVLFSYRKHPGQISADPERMRLGQVHALTRTLLRLRPDHPRPLPSSTA